ncbi:major facilitator superfamily domain-containing protein [Plectosphaerella cucumerina]|uniref:Major facilitator superfamily domain-containing protein n=1 Tax=Plectosphaerella cucumerina TaxID=40658 RepID=A0A8K0TU15_9PEZI|nr:major facilitator superfamily domain-containing protein [Plectosphaerella cucumerina]
MKDETENHPAGPGPAADADAEAASDSGPVPSEHTLDAWLTVAGSFLVYFVCFGFMTGFGFFQDYYAKHQLQSYPPSLVALIGSLQLGLMYLVGPITGVLFDAYGPKRLYLGGATGAIISCIGLSFAQPNRVWQHFLSQGLLFGLTVSFGTQTALAVTGQHFRRNRALAMGVVAGGSSAGGVCFPIMFSRLVPRLGFAWSVRLAALLFLVCYTLAVFLTRSTSQGRGPLRSARDILDFRGFKDPRYAVLAFAMVVGNLGLYVPYNFIEAFLRFYHPTASIGSYLLPLINGSSFFGRVFGGLIADRIGGLNLLYPMTLVAGLLCLTMWLLARSVALIVTFACLYGFCSGIFISVVPSVVARISPDKHIGARLGAFFSLGAIGVFTGTPIGGAFIRDGTETEFRNLIVFAGCTMTGAGVLMAVARVLCDRNLRTKW